MSSKKITTADKLEIVNLYRHGGDTTASLANRYGVSNSTISRLLKTSIPEAEYEILIQQKRGVKIGIEDEYLTTPVASSVGIAAAESEIDLVEAPQDLALPILPSPVSVTIDDDTAPRKLRRRSSAPASALSAVASDDPAPAEQVVLPTVTVEAPIVQTPTLSPSLPEISTRDSLALPTPAAPPISRTPVLRDIVADSESRYAIPVVPEVSVDELEDEEDDDDTEDVNVLAAMFGEEVADSDDDDDEEDDDDDDTTTDRPLDPNQLLTKDRLHVQITPLSQATLPRTCYIVIDKFAELIVRPLKDFADLGQISSEETQQRTLPIFDNHRVAKRFSNQRTQRVIKVPDSKVFYKTTQHLKLKGITRLLVDGNIYSLN